MNVIYEPPVVNWVEVGDIRMRYLDWGGDGAPVIALHGLASSAHWYDTVAPLLRDKYRIIAPDQRGHGQTMQASGGYDWDRLSRDVVELMDVLGIPQALVWGHSWGGNVAINVAAKFPERVSSLVLIDGGTWDPKLRSLATWESFSQRLAPRVVTGTRDEYLAMMRDTFLWMCWSDEIARILLTMVLEGEDGQMVDILRPDNHAQVLRAMWDDPASATWPLIQTRTLIVSAGAMPDRANSEFAVMRKRNVEAANEAIKNSRVHWIPETIHDIGWHKPQELADAIDAFLSEG